MSADHGQNPHGPQGAMSVTLKQDEPGGKYNDAKVPGSWIVFHGTPAQVGSQIRETFPGIEGDNEYSLHDLVIEATRLYKATGNAGRVLGASSAKEESGGAWAEARGESAPAEEKAPPTLAEIIEACESVPALKELWLDRSEEIKKDGLVEAWTARAAVIKGE